MKKIYPPDAPLFNITQDSYNIVTIRASTTIDLSKLDLLGILENFVSLLTTVLQEQTAIAGVIYYCPVACSKDFYQELFEAAKQQSFESRILKILALSTIINTANKPVIAVIDSPYNSFQLAPMFWASHIIATENVQIDLPDCRLGIFPGFGVTVYVSSRMDISHAATLLVRSNPLTAKEANAAGLLNQIAVDSKDAHFKATQWILTNSSIDKQTKTKLLDENNFEAQIAPVRKKINPLFPGINTCITLIAESRKLPLEKALVLEAKCYAMVLSSKEALGIMRTTNYGIPKAKNLERISGLPAFNFHKISVLGAGMMGSGIAYEIARAGIIVCLKDTDIAFAIKGKKYTERCCDKLIQIGKMKEGEKEEMLSLIHPTDNTQDLADSDFIIEAVFEDKKLKENVIAQSAPFLKSNGFFASNTTSLPITELASYVTKSENFIGMHFFSPVDRMPLVEIIRGKQTSDETLNKAIQLALKLQKTPIVVHDSPAFFTSRIFFNYLLEAITMLLEGIPAANIEEEAVKAGFAVSPLAVLDEISIPLMLHVYDQLPALSSSQKRCYNYLSKLVKAGRIGRKSEKGFYDYVGAAKQIWQDSALMPLSHLIDSLIIQKRLLHVMALDSYRCLIEGVLDQPIDGDIGSILGVGYAAHTGGVFAYMDEISIPQFVKDCESFNSFGEQWEIPSSLRKLAKQSYSFYNGFTSNWPLENK